jgi:hypothetical protein
LVRVAQKATDDALAARRRGTCAGAGRQRVLVTQAHVAVIALATPAFGRREARLTPRQHESIEVDRLAGTGGAHPAATPGAACPVQPRAPGSAAGSRRFIITREPCFRPGATTQEQHAGNQQQRGAACRSRKGPGDVIHSARLALSRVPGNGAAFVTVPNRAEACRAEPKPSRQAGPRVSAPASGTGPRPGIS